MAWNAVKIMNDSDLEGRSIHVREDKVAEATEAAHAGKTNGGGRSRRQVDIPAEEKIVEPNKVFVSNLTWTTSEEVRSRAQRFLYCSDSNGYMQELITFFCSVGDVVDLEIRQTRAGRSLGCGVVEFSNAAYARSCIDTMNGKELNGRVLAIREYYQ